jgi:hypothetical protein
MRAIKQLEGLKSRLIYQLKKAPKGYEDHFERLNLLEKIEKDIQIEMCYIQYANASIEASLNG